MTDETEQSRALLRALAHLRATDPALVKWIEDGHPNLTDEEHFQRFGHAHPDTVRRRKRLQKKLSAYQDPE